MWPFSCYAYAKEVPVIEGNVSGYNARICSV